MPRVIKVIETSITKGNGEENSPYRTVMQYYTLKGKLLAEKDDWEIEKQYSSVTSLMRGK